LGIAARPDGVNEREFREIGSLAFIIPKKVYSRWRSWAQIAVAAHRKSKSMNKKYLKLLDEGWEISSNTFAALGLENSERLQAKAYLRAAILAQIAALEITQVEAARRVGVTQPKMSTLMADTAPRGFSSDKLMEFATKLGLDVTIRVQPSRSELGKVMVAEGIHPIVRRDKARSRKA
jgi:predicted XRE-type DNA-binding protein